MTAPTEPPAGRRRPTVLIALVAVLLAATLAWLFWPEGAKGPTVSRASAGPYTVQLSVESPHLGTNSFTVEVTDTAGGGPAALDAVTVEPVMPLMGHAISPVAASTASPGRYQTAGTYLPMSGQWEITVSLSGQAGYEQLVFPLLVNN